MEAYLRQSGEHMIRASENPEIPVKLLGSWTTIIGAQLDQATHIWQYTGYDKVSETAEKLNNDKVSQDEPPNSSYSLLLRFHFSIGTSLQRPVTR